MNIYLYDYRHTGMRRLAHFPYDQHLTMLNDLSLAGVAFSRVTDLDRRSGGITVLNKICGVDIVAYQSSGI